MSRAKDAVLAGMDADGDNVIDLTPMAGVFELTPWVDGALPDLDPKRRSLLVRELAAAGLTLARMTEAAQLPGGFNVLVHMLDTHNLRSGDRLALASAAMRTVASNAHACVQPPVSPGGFAAVAAQRP